MASLLMIDNTLKATYDLQATGVDIYGLRL